MKKLLAEITPVPIRLKSILIYLLAGVLLELNVVSCQINSNLKSVAPVISATAPSLNSSPIQPSFTITLEPIIEFEKTLPEPAPSSIYRTITPFLGNLSASLKLEGILSATKFGTGNYLQYDFTTGKLNNIDLPLNCFPMQVVDKAFCNSAEGFSILFLGTGNSTFYRMPKAQKLKLNNSETFVLYSYSEKMHGYSIWVAKKIESGIEWNLTGEIRDVDILSIPELSYSGLYLIIHKYEDSSSRENLFLFEPGGQEGTSIGFQDMEATINYSWAPSKNVLAYGATTMQLEIGWCTNRLILYDVGKRENRILLSLPELSCLDDFGEHGIQSVWSPDSGKVMVVVDRDTICSISVENGEKSCLKVTGSEERLGHIVWSPDSKYLAYTVSNEKSRSLKIFILNPEAGEQIPISELTYDTGVVVIYWQSFSP